MTLKTDRNISEWRELRSQLSNYDDKNKLIETLNYFSKIPLVNYVLDFNNPDSWLTPWEIIVDDYYDDICIVILICETLMLSNFDSDRFKLKYVQDSVDNSSFMILIVDDKDVINFSYNQIVSYNDIKNRIRTIQSYKIKNSKYIKD